MISLDSWDQASSTHSIILFLKEASYFHLHFTQPLIIHWVIVALNGLLQHTSGTLIYFVQPTGMITLLHSSPSNPSLSVKWYSQDSQVKSCLLNEKASKIRFTKMLISSSFIQALPKLLIAVRNSNSSPSDLVFLLDARKKQMVSIWFHLLQQLSIR